MVDVDPRSPAMPLGSAPLTITCTWGNSGRQSPSNSSYRLASCEAHRRWNTERLHVVEPLAGRRAGDGEYKVLDGTTRSDLVSRVDHGRGHRGRSHRPVVEYRRGWRTVRWPAGTRRM